MEELAECKAPPTATAGSKTIAVYFHCAADDWQMVRPVFRSVPQQVNSLRGALQQLLTGPSAAEREAGFGSWFSSSTAGKLRSVDVDEAGRATVDCKDLSTDINSNVTTTTGRFVLLAQLDSTVFQFDGITSVKYQFDGSCDAFWRWLESSCHGRPRAQWASYVSVAGR